MENMKVKDIESFLRFVNFYRRFIQNFSHTAKPLNELKEKKNGYGIKNIRRLLKS